MRVLLFTFEAWLCAPAPAERLASLRIAIGGFVVSYMIFNVYEFQRLADRDRQAFDPIGVARLLGSPLAASAIWLLFAGLLMAGTAFTLGVAVRVSGPAFALLVLFWTSYHSSWGQLLHFEHLFTLHILILALAPTADVWALRARSVTAPSVRYGWPIRLLAIATVTTYALSGIAKLRHSGMAWFDPDTLATHIGYSAARMETIGADLPPLARPILEARWLILPTAVAALAVELAAPIALFGRTPRNIWFAGALLFHAATAATMHVFFGYRGLAIAMLPLFHLERLPGFMSDRFLRFAGWRRPRSTADLPRLAE